jgi:large subunit ribosomal protein L7/L12
MATTLSRDELLDAIGNMTVLELSEFVKAFEEKFGVTAAAPDGGRRRAGRRRRCRRAGRRGADGVRRHPPGFGDKKIQVIKVVREITASASRRPRTWSTARRSR